MRIISHCFYCIAALACSIMYGTQSSSAQGWYALSSGMNSTVRCFGIYNNYLYAGGAFTTAGGVSATRIAKWNGSSWSAIGSTVNNTVYALTEYVLFDDLAAGGAFTTPESRFIRWDGASTWDGNGSGMNNTVTSLLYYSGYLYAGGYFTIANGSSIYNIARTSGTTTWSGYGGDPGGNVYAITIYGGNIIIGGQFDWDIVTLEYTSFVKVYSGGSWLDLGGPNAAVRDFYVIGSNLYAAGDFDYVGAQSTPGVAMYNGSTWSRCGTALPTAQVLSLGEYQGQLVAGGGFTTINGVSANYIAKWNGTSWSALGSGTNATVYALSYFNNELYIGGSFTTAGGISAAYVAKYGCNDLAASISVTNDPCNDGTCAGALTASATGGKTSYTYSWSGGLGTGATKTSVCAGNYTVTVTDAYGCTTTATATITQPAAALAASTSVINVTCNGLSNGSATVTASGGTSPYSYSWSGGGTTTSKTNLAAGTYTVTVTDSKGCTKTGTATVTQPAVLSASNNITNITCYGLCNGSASVTASGGTTPYSYFWSTSATTSGISSLCANTYYVTVTDNKGCTNANTVTVTQPAALAASTSVTNVNCYGQCTGAATVTASGGTPSYTYSWSGGGTTSTKTSLCSGNYTVTVTDSKGCTKTATATITQPTSLNPSISKTDASCYNVCNGTASVSASGGFSPYSYQWSTGSTTSSVSSLCGCSIGTQGYNMPGGTVNVSTGKFYDTGGNAANYGYNENITTSLCPSSAGQCVTVSFTSFSVESYYENLYIYDGPDAASPQVPGSPFTGNTSPGTITSTHASGCLTFRFTSDNVFNYAGWAANIVTATCGSLPSCVYSVTVTDSKGCTKSNATLITQPDLLSATGSVTHASCFGTCNGAINLTASGGTTAYTYNWADVPGTSNPEDRTSLCAGSYTVTVTDSKGCTYVYSTTVTQPTALSSTTSSTSVSCNGGNNGTATVSGSGGTTPYSYAWITGSASSTISSLSAGTYTVTVTDNKGCTISNTAIVTEPAAVTALIAPTHVTCNGDGDGVATATPAGGTPPYAYIWNDPVPAQSTATATGLSPGNYTITVTDSKSCTGTASVTITEPAVLSSSAIIQNVSCFGGGDGAVDLTPSGGTPSYTYEWSNASTTQDLTALTANSYAVTITDANGCIATRTATVTQPVILSVSISKTNATCGGTCNGTATATPSGGTSPYSYLWNDVLSQTTQISTGLCAASYSATVTDSKGCTTSQSIAITEPVTVSVSTSTTAASCGIADGTATATVSGGTSPYTYGWSSGSTESLATGLAAGIYNVTATDATGCTKVAQATVNSGGGMSSSIVKMDVSCYAGNNGSLDLSVSGGTLPYTFTWSNSSTDEDIDSLTAGAYSVTVTDNNSCVIANSATITQPVLLAVNISKSNALCYGNSNGSINLTVSGGTSPFTYQWSNSSTNEDISSLSAGKYTITVTDNKGCSLIDSSEVTQPVQLTASVTKSDISCFGLCDGQATANPAGGTAPYVYLWNDASSQNTQTATGLCQGAFNVNISDANNCQATPSVNIFEPAVLNITVSSADASCGLTDGSAAVTPAGGNTPYSYLWSDNSTTSVLNGLGTGTYNVTVTDARGCTESDSTTISSPLTIPVTFNKVDILCWGGNNGSASVTPVSATYPFTYSWSSGSVDSVISSIQKGTYSVTVTDMNGCTAIDSIAITGPAQLAATFVINTVLCYGNSNGSINLTVSGGTLPLTYDWSNNATTEDISSLAAGFYAISVSDNNGCILIDSVDVTQPAQLTATVSKSDISCYGLCDGSAEAVITGGTFPYMYLWSDPSSQTTLTATGLCPGSYNVNVSDANNCQVTPMVTVSEPSVLTINMSFTNTSCGISDGEAIVLATGGTTPYTYSWSNGGITDTLPNLSAGIYSVTVRDDNGCNLTGDVTLTSATTISSSSGKTDVTCNGGNDGNANISPLNGTAPFSFSWSNGDTVANAQNLVAGTYTATVTDAFGCTAVDIVTITQPSGLSISFLVTAAACFGNSNGSIDAGVSGGVSPYTYSWSTGGTNSSVNGLSSGFYSVTVTDNSNCTIIDSSEVTQPAQLTADINPVHVTCNSFCNGSAEVFPSGGTSPYIYLWSDSAGQTSSMATGLCPGTYNVNVSDARNCQATPNVTITEPLSLTLSVSATSATCNHDDGTTTAAPGGGTQPYVYNWSNGDTNATAAAAGSGNYTVTISDANGCTISSNIPVNVNAVPQEICLVTVDSATGKNLVAWEKTGGYGTDHYIIYREDTALGLYDSIGTVPFDSLSELVDLGSTPRIHSDRYGVVAVDSCGNYSGMSFQHKTIHLAVVYNIDGFTRELIWEPYEGFNFGTYTIWRGTKNDSIVYLGSVVSTTTQYSDPDTVAVNPGDSLYYIVSVVHPNPGGCTASLKVKKYNSSKSNTASLQAPSVGIVVLVAGTGTTCNGDNDGTANVNATGGTPPYSYQWSNGGSQLSVTGLAAGIYYITVTDSQGNSVTGNTTVSEPAAITIFTATTDATCNNADGSATATAGGGNGSFTYIWSNNQTGSISSGLGAQTYSVTATDALGCTGTANVVVLSNNIPLNIVTTSTAVSCYGGNNGTATVIPLSGTAPYAYQWDASASNQSNATATGLAAGNFNVTVTDAKGCYNTQSVSVTEPAQIVLAVSTVSSTCGNADGSATVSASGGVGAFSYLWNNGQSAATATALTAGNYMVTVKDANNCSQTAIASVSDANAPSVAISSTDVTCNGDGDGTATVSTTGGTPPYTYLWDGSTGNQTDSTATGLNGGNYSVSVYDGGGCLATGSAAINEPAALIVTAIVTDANAPGNSDGVIDITVTGGIGAYTYLWSTAGVTEDLTGLSAGIYTVTVTDANNCEVFRTDTVDLINSAFYHSPFTTHRILVYPNPNNGSFAISTNNESCTNQRICELRIINILGEVVYSEVFSDSYIRKFVTNSLFVDLDLPDGVYTLWVETDDGQVIGMKKVVIAR